MATYVALLRSVNVGGTAKLPMAALREAAAESGFEGVTTVLQSGNLVFRAEGAAAALEHALERMVEARFGFTTPVMLRTGAEWSAAIKGNPFPDAARGDPAHLLVCALKGPARAGAEASLRDAILGREQVRIIGREAYLVYLDGIGTSKLTTQVLERHFGTPCTGRNWNTVLKIAAALG